MDHEDTAMDFLSDHDFSPWNFLLGLLGWRVTANL
jgi:hypothetical protein